MLNVPQAYVKGYSSAQAIDRKTADNYIRYTTIDDPLMDAAVKDLADKLKLQKSNLLKMQAALFQFRGDKVFGRLLERVTGTGGNSLVTAFGASLYDHAGLRYNMPDHVNAEQSSGW